MLTNGVHSWVSHVLCRQHAKRLCTLLAVLMLAWYGASAVAAVSCEQLAQIALTTQQLRDQGNSLAAVLAQVDDPAMAAALAPAERERIKLVVQLAFTGERSPEEILQACKAEPQR
jgi:hypothetical protein